MSGFNLTKSTKWGAIIITISSIVSIVLANTTIISSNEIGLGIFVIWFYPPFVGFLTIAFYLVVIRYLKRIHILFIIILSFLNIYFGYLLHFNLI